MDISNMYCRADSEHLEEFIELVGEQFGEGASRKVTCLSKNSGCVEVVADGWMDKSGWYEMSGYTEFTGPWSIYSNNKPLSELTDSQSAELFNWWRKGGVMEVLFSDEGWSDVDPIWGIGSIYRAKPKSEKELFIESAAKVMFEAEGGNHQINDITLGVLFDARFKAPKGDE